MGTVAGMPRLRVAVDVGGTFTDVFVLDEDSGGVHVAKVPSTPSDPMEGVMAGVEAGGVELSDVSLFSHGTTVATNALITRRFEAAAMVTTRNFRDVLEIRAGPRTTCGTRTRTSRPRTSAAATGSR